MAGHPVTAHDLEAVLRYWQLCGIDHLIGADAGAAFRLPAPVATRQTAIGHQGSVLPQGSGQPFEPSAKAGDTTRGQPSFQTPPFGEQPPWLDDGPSDSSGQAQFAGEALKAGVRPSAPKEGGHTPPPAPQERFVPRPATPRTAKPSLAPTAPSAAATPALAPPLPPLATLPPLSSAEKVQAMAELATTVAACTQCELSQSRTRTVFGVGTTETRVVFVGEAPGEDEDRLGEPFVGAAGKLLDKMVQSIGLERQQIFIANVLKCRPPANRNPLPNEVALCQSFLVRQLEIIHPPLIFAMGKFAIATLLGHEGPIGEVRGKVLQWRGVPVIATYHPAYYLRQPSRKQAAWQDLILLMKTLETQS